MRRVLEKLARGELSVDEAERMIKALLLEEVSSLALLDLGREVRRGVPEIVLAEGKPPEATARIAKAILDRCGRVIVSRASREHMESVKEALGDAEVEVHEAARILVARRTPIEKTGGRVGVITAGTSDIPVAEEAKVVARELGCEVYTAYDVGVAGVHRVFKALRDMVENDVDVIVVAAGMEGALPSVVASMVDIPVIGLPTSVGYGIGGKGEAALKSMLQSCSLGVAVVNVDAGVAAGVIAAMIANRAAKFRS
ncbi:MAG: nickel pincer cofactor biosynthesis protein LarB [Thermoproteota archaeon]|nr:MAG: nickel pincer cofactor biosynthesis protein LarB [Candidatus Korarchaeota archaeon]